MLQFRDNILQSESSKQNNRTKLLKHVCMNYYIQGRTTFQIFRAFKRKGLRGSNRIYFKQNLPRIIKKI